MIRLYQLYERFEYAIQPFFAFLEHFALVFARIYVSWIFLKSGLLKIQSWDTTLMLFEYEYKVPLLSPYAAAVLGTFGELVFPVLLILGLFSRFSALSLIVVNITAAISLADIGHAALLHHVNWGILLAFVFIRGGGMASTDFLINMFRKKRSE